MIQVKSDFTVQNTTYDLICEMNGGLISLRESALIHDNNRYM